MTVTGQPSSVDPAQVAYYERLADLWWDETGPFWPLHRLNGFRIRYIRDVLVRVTGRDGGAALPLSGLSVLDIGCGGGILSESMDQLGARVHGIDVTEKNIHVARRHAAQNQRSVSYEHVSAETLSQRSPESYDVVLNMEVVEHVADLPIFLAACCRLVKPGGLMLVATLNRTGLSWLFAIVGAEYILRWLPRGTHQWGRFRRPEEVEGLLAEHDLSVIDRTGVRVNPFTRGFSHTRSLAVNYMMTARKTPPPNP
jgi:2-polyprenyl-6-hydroxyphenyl methylase/3-demethylubiquinone-9 3-methyltransferase